MPIRPSLVQFCKHLILLQRYIYLNLSLRVYYQYFVHLLRFLFLLILLKFLNKYWKFDYEVKDALHKTFFPLALRAL
jgi:hypothetical protein